MLGRAPCPGEKQGLTSAKTVTTDLLVDLMITTNSFKWKLATVLSFWKWKDCLNTYFYEEIVWICWRGCMRYFSIVSVLPTVDGFWHASSLEKQTAVWSWTLSNILLWMGEAAKCILATVWRSKMEPSPCGTVSIHVGCPANRQRPCCVEHWRWTLVLGMW